MNFDAIFGLRCPMSAKGVLVWMASQPPQTISVLRLCDEQRMSRVDAENSFSVLKGLGILMHGEDQYSEAVLPADSAIRTPVTPDVAPKEEPGPAVEKEEPTKKEKKSWLK